MNRQQTSAAVRLGLSIVLLVLLFSIVDIDNIWQTVRTMDLPYFFIGLVFYVVYVVLWGGRWFIIMRAANEPVRYSQALSTLTIGIFFSIFLPTLVGTDVGRMYELSREQGKSTRVISSVLLDRLIGMASLIITALVALIVGGYEYVGDAIVPVVVIGLLFGLVIGWLLFFNKRFMHLFDWVFKLPVVRRFDDTLRQLYNVLHELQRQPRLLIISLFIALIMVVLEILSVIFIAVALGVEINFVFFFLFMPIIWIVMVIPISVGGLGLREGAFAFFFSQVGMSGSDAVAISLLYYTFSVIVGLGGGIVLLRGSVIDALRNSRSTVEQATSP